MTSKFNKFIVGASPDEVIDWDNDPRVNVVPVGFGSLGSAPTILYEYGARDPDDHSRIHAHRNFEMAEDAAEWWRIDGKVYVRQVTEWKVLDD